MIEVCYLIFKETALEQLIYIYEGGHYLHLVF